MFPQQSETLNCSNCNLGPNLEELFLNHGDMVYKFSPFPTFYSIHHDEPEVYVYSSSYFIEIDFVLKSIIDINKYSSFECAVNVLKYVL